MWVCESVRIVASTALGASNDKITFILVHLYCSIKENVFTVKQMNVILAIMKVILTSVKKETRLTSFIFICTQNLKKLLLFLDNWKNHPRKIVWKIAHPYFGACFAHCNNRDIFLVLQSKLPIVNTTDQQVSITQFNRESYSYFFMYHFSMYASLCILLYVYFSLFSTWGFINQVISLRIIK